MFQAIPTRRFPVYRKLLECCCYCPILHLVTFVFVVLMILSLTETYLAIKLAFAIAHQRFLAVLIVIGGIIRILITAYWYWASRSAKENKRAYSATALCTGLTCLVVICSIFILTKIPEDVPPGILLGGLLLLDILFNVVIGYNVAYLLQQKTWEWNDPEARQERSMEDWNERRGREQFLRDKMKETETSGDQLQ